MPDTPSRAAKVTVVEDDESIRELLGASLRFAGYEVTTAADGSNALSTISGADPDLVVLDVNLPDVDGFELCRRLRSVGNDVPVVFLTARRDTDDLRTGFGNGGDDYLTKPFSLDELTFRIEAVLRRSGRRSRPAHRIGVGHVELDTEARRVWSAGVEVSLTPTEFRLAEYLFTNVDRVVSRGQILVEVWPDDFDGDWRIIETHVSSLRRKLETHHPDRVIHTVRGVGYSARRPPLR